MSIISLLQKELEGEAITTQKMLSRIPNDQLEWQPHTKSMVMGRLATHIAELPSWIKMTLSTEELDFSTAPYEPYLVKTNADLISYFEKCLAEGIKALSEVSDDQLWPQWTLRNGEEIYSVSTKYEVIRMSLGQIIHHRAQLGVYLRLLDIPIPGSYGPSADDMSF
jgi:uncharacterized damage-inducible protein DinB